MPDDISIQTFPYPHDLRAAVDELRYGEPPWLVTLGHEHRGQDCEGLTLNIYPDKPDSYHPEQHVRTRFLYPVPAAHFNRESWEEWLWARIEETEGHERAENFKFATDVEGEYRRPFKPAHADGWDPGTVRSVVSETVTNTPNAGRLVQIPCVVCNHTHGSKMGEHFTIETIHACTENGCPCKWSFKRPAEG